MNNRIIIADILSNTINGKQTGHYFAVARNYLELFYNCVVAGGPIYKTGFDKEKLCLLPYNGHDGDNFIGKRFKTFSNAMKLFKDGKGDVIVLQQCTTITTFLCIILFYHRKSRLYIIQYSLEGFRNFAGRLLYRFAKRKIDGLVCPNDEVGKAYGIPYCVVPDYIYTGQSFVKRISYDEKKYDFCMIGRISAEKGISEVVRFISKTSCNVLIAGRVQNKELEEELKNLCNNVNNITLVLDYISDEEYKMFLSQSRYAILNYQGEYSNRSSGVVYDTIFAGLPVIGRRCKALNFIKEFNMGFLYESIGDFNPKVVLNKKQYEYYQKQIAVYRMTHEKYKRELNVFIKDSYLE